MYPGLHHCKKSVIVWLVLLSNLIQFGFSIKMILQTIFTLMIIVHLRKKSLSECPPVYSLHSSQEIVHCEGWGWIGEGGGRVWNKTNVLQHNPAMYTLSYTMCCNTYGDKCILSFQKGLSCGWYCWMGAWQNKIKLCNVGSILRSNLNPYKWITSEPNPVLKSHQPIFGI